MEKIKVLFLCIHKSARSQMAEAYLKKIGGDTYFAESAGLEAGKLNPFAVEAMKADGIDISGNTTKDVFEFHKEGRTYNYVVTVCDEASASQCPIFPGVHKKINWSFPDPSQFAGGHEDKLASTIEVRNTIKKAVLSFIDDVNSKT